MCLNSRVSKNINSVHSYMNSLKRSVSLVLPSGLSFLSCLTLSLIIFFAAGISYNTKTGVIYRYLFGANSSTDFIHSASDTISGLNHTLLSNPILNNLVWFSMWMLLGLLVYSLLGIAINSVKTFSSDIKELDYIHANKKSRFEFYGLHLAIMAMVIVLTVLYCLVFIKILLPFSLFSFQLGLSTLGSISGWLYVLLSLVVLLLSLHVFTVLLRVAVLRYRFFGAST